MISLLALLTLVTVDTDRHLAWDHNGSNNVSGYRIYADTKLIWSGTDNKVPINRLNLSQGNTYHLTVTAFDNAGTESTHSIPLVVEVQSPIPIPTRLHFRE